MKITRVKAEGWDNYTQEAVFGDFNHTQYLEILSGKQTMPSEIEDMLGYNLSNPQMLRHGLRIALLYQRWQATLDRMLDDKAAFSDMETRNHIYKFKNCTIDGANADITTPLHPTCKNYRLCPWCRYRLVQELFEWIGPKLHQTDKIAVAKFRFPMSGFDGLAPAHRRVIDATCKERNVWLGDYTITLPVWVQGGDYINGLHDPRYTPMMETSILVFAKEGTPLILPENAISQKARSTHNMDFLSPHGWLVWKNTKKGLMEAAQHMTAFPSYLWSQKSVPLDFIEVLEYKNKLRAVGHGLLGKH